MAFHHEAAQRFLRMGDRDRTPYFAGRERQLRHFQAGLQEACDKPRDAAIFRLYQGAPGAGKSALAKHIEAQNAGRALFVRVSPQKCTDIDTIRDLARTAAEDTDGLLARLGRHVVRGSAEAMRITRLGDEVATALSSGRHSRIPVILHIDEAQGLAGRNGPALVDLHTIGLEVAPCVVLLTGLTHSEHNVRATAPGMSRLSADACVQMEPMPAAEAMASTTLMLDDLRTHGSAAGRTAALEVVTRAAQGWPQHLHFAQHYLCEELCRTDGDLDAVALAHVADATTESREDYYRKRLEDHPLALDSLLVARIVADVEARSEGPGSMARVELYRVVDEHWSRHADEAALRRMSTVEAYADALTEKGVLTPLPNNGGFATPIPSMSTWLREQLGAATAPREGPSAPEP